MSEENRELPGWVKREGIEGHEVPKGVVFVDGLSRTELINKINENKILVGTHEELEHAFEELKIKLPGKNFAKAKPLDAWIFNASNKDYAKYVGQANQVHILYIDSQGMAALIDLASADEKTKGKEFKQPSSDYLIKAVEATGLNAGKNMEDNNNYWIDRSGVVEDVDTAVSLVSKKRSVKPEPSVSL